MNELTVTCLLLVWIAGDTVKITYEAQKVCFLKKKVQEAKRRNAKQLANNGRLWVYRHTYMYMHAFGSFSQLKNNIHVCAHRVMYALYINNWQTLQDCVCMDVCVRVSVCVPAEGGTGKNNVTEVDKRMRVKCFRGRCREARSLVYSNENKH